MKFSIIMPSRLQPYPGAASERDRKLIRAIQSCLKQTFSDWEILIIADGCLETIGIVTEFIEDERIKLMKVEHQKLWSGRPRNTGIENAKGEWLTYLDIDDIYGENHLQTINDNLANFDWVWYDDIRYRPRLDYWYENSCDIHVMGRHGTSNITHKRELNVFWDEDGKYAHDFHFVQKLLKFKNGGKIPTPEYYVCHIPGVYDL